MKNSEKEELPCLATMNSGEQNYTELKVISRVNFPL